MADELIKALGLIPYPSDLCKHTYFIERYRSELKVKPLADDRPERDAVSVVYVLGRKGERGMWRRLKSDETMLYHKGNAKRLFVIKPDGKLEDVLVGDVQKDSRAMFNYTIVANSWFSFCLADGEDDYGLCSAVVAPGYDALDVETIEPEKLAEIFPQHQQIIMEFAKK